MSQTTSDYVLRRPVPADNPSLQRLAQSMWPTVRPDVFATRWWWNDPEAPHCRVAIHQPTGEVAAMCGERRTRLWHQGRVVPVGSTFDWYVSPEHGGHGLGRKLVECGQDEFEYMVATSASESANKALPRLGFTHRVRVPVLVAQPVVVAALTRAFAPAHTTHNLNLTAHLTAIDQVWNAQSANGPTMMVRDSAQVRQHLALVPRRSYRASAHWRGSDATAWALYRTLPAGAIRRAPWLRVGLVSDFLTRPDAGRDLLPLLHHVALDLARQGCSVMAVLCSSSELIRWLHRAGFVSGRHPITGRWMDSVGIEMMHWVSPRSLPDDNLPGFMDGWHVTFADNDADLVLGCLVEP